MQAVKRRAVETGRTMTQVIEGALRVELSRSSPAGSTPPVDLPTFGSGGVLPGVDLDDTSALLDRMDGR